MTTPDHLAHVEAFYEAALRQGEDDAARVGWEATGAQKLRFEALLEALPRSAYGPSLRLLDVGCGLGALVDYLEATGRTVDYRGIDVHPDMVAEARQRHPGRRFDVADVLALDVEGDAADLVVASGTLSLRFDDEETSWRVIEHMVALSRQATAFNVQSTRGVAESGANAMRLDFWYVDPEVLHHRMRQLCADVVLREDVLPSDAFVYLFTTTSQGTLERAALTPLERAEVHAQRRCHRAALAELAAHPDPSARAAFLRGVCLAHLDQDEEASIWLRKAAEQAPDDLDIAETLVHFSLSLGELDAARAIVDAMASRAAAGDAGVLRDRIRRPLHERLVFEGEVEAARLLEETADTEHGRLLMQGGRLVASARWADAESALGRAGQLAPHDGTPRVLLALAVLRQGRPAEALRGAAQILGISPTHPVAREVGLEALRRLGRSARGTGAAAVAARQAIEEVLQHAVLGPIARRIAV